MTARKRTPVPPPAPPSDPQSPPISPHTPYLSERQQQDLGFISSMSSRLLIRMATQPQFAGCIQQLPAIATSLAEQWVHMMRAIEAEMESQGATKQ